MLRMPLVELCLQIKLLSLGFIRPFLSKVSILPSLIPLMILSIGYSSQIIFLFQALEPPREEAMASAISLLYEVPIIFMPIIYFSYGTKLFLDCFLFLFLVHLLHNRVHTCWLMYTYFLLRDVI